MQKYIDQFVQMVANAIEFNSVMIFSISIVGSMLILTIYSYFDLKYTQIDRQVRRQIKMNRESASLDSLSERYTERFKQKIKDDLDRSGILFTPEEYVTTAMVAVILGAAYGFIFNPLSAVAGDNLLLQLILRIAATAGFGYLGIFIPKFWVHVLITRKQTALRQQISDALLNLADAIKSGHIIQDAIRIVGEEMPYPIGNEFRRTANEIDTGKSLNDSLQDLKRRIDLEDFSLAVNAVEISFETGGKLEPLLRGIVNTISEREAMRREMEKSIAGSKSTGYILLIAPLAFTGMFTLANKEAYSQMLTTPVGIGASVGAAVSYVIGAFIIFSILHSLRKD